MFMITDDPARDADRYYSELEEARERAVACLPVCSRCKEHIEDDDLYDFDGELVCEECLSDYIAENYKKPTTAYIEERYL